MQNVDQIMTRRIDAVRIWRDSDSCECRLLYRIFVHSFHGNFHAIRRDYGWKREPMLRALRIGKSAHESWKQKRKVA